MKLNRLRVEQFRQFRQPIELQFEPGLNLFSGPNESGKSTLVRAIRAAFFERYSTSSVDDLRPWGDSSAAPEVALEFEFNQQSWRLNKRFLARKRCDLLIGNQAFENEEAENRLGDLLGYQFSSRGASKAEHWGVPGLLWVEQGSGQELESAVHHAGERLQSALGQDLGAVASSAGDEVLRRVSAQRGELLTERGAPRAQYKVAISRVEELTAECQALDGRIEQYRQAVDRLGALREQQVQESSARPWEALEQQLAHARQQLELAASLKQEQQRTQHALLEQTRELELIAAQLSDLHQQQTDLERRQGELQQLQLRQQELMARQTQLQPRLDSAQQAFDQAQTLQRQQQEQQRRQELERQLSQAQQEQQRLQASLSRVRSLQVQLLEVQQGLQRVVLEPRALKQLEQQQAQLRELQIRQHSSATRLRYMLDPDVQIELGAVTLKGQGEQHLTALTTLNLPGVGQLQIQPGGQDLDDVQRQLQQAQQTFETGLRHYQLQSLDEARERVEQSRQLQGQRDQLQSSLSALAPEGTDQLVAALSLSESRIQQLQTQLASLPAPQADLPAASELALEVKRAEQVLKQLQTEVGELSTQLIRIETQLGASQQELTRVQQRLSHPQRKQQLQQLLERKQELELKGVALRQQLTQLEAQIAAARPDLLEQDITRLSRSLQSMQAQRETRSSEIIRLEGMLGGQGAEGLEEQRAALAVELEQARRRQQQLEIRAKALDLLQARLTEKRDALTRRLQAPLVQHINHYLGVLFPGARIEVDDKLVPGQLSRNGEAIGFNDLSFGAREQMGLISRLAYADLLRTSGHPTLIILDDALVHSDRQRLDQMKRILYDAAQRHQILIFTCHPQDWVDLGVTARELAGLKARG